MTTNPSTGDTVIPTKTSTITTPGEGSPRNTDSLLARAESTPAARKRHLELSSPKNEVPRKSPRREELELRVEEKVEEVRSDTSTMCVTSNLKRTESRSDVPKDKSSVESTPRKRQTIRIPSSIEKRLKPPPDSSLIPKALKRPSEETSEGQKSLRKNRPDVPDETSQSNSTTLAPRKPQVQRLPGRDEAAKLRKTIQWLEEGARRMREDLATTRAELHEERRAAKLAKRELDSAVKDAKVGEAARHLQVISELKSRLTQSPTRPGGDATSTSSKAEFLKEENHRRELSALRKRLTEAEATVQKLKANACNPHGSGKRRKVESPDGRRMEIEVQALKAANKKLEERLQVVTEAERKRGTELRIQHENHEAQLAALQKTLRSDTIKMMDEIRSKTREIEKLEKLVLEGSQMHRKLQTKEDDLMRQLRETERTHQVRLAPRIEEEISNSTNHDENSCNGDCDAAAEVERLREISIEQQEIIEVLRQAVKEKERKLDQISNKKRKEEFYKQWLELEPVVEVEDEEEHENEEGDSALSSAPSSMSPQPGNCGQWQHTGIPREAYETVLLEVEELQTSLVEEQRELAHAKSQVRELEKALLQETRGSQNSRRALSDKLREIEEREATLVAEISELREQNELLEFRVLELEETPCLRNTPHPADSGIVSPEPIHLYKNQLSNNQRDRAVATVIPYNTYNTSVSPILQKLPLSLQESGIFDEEDEPEVELSSCGTQTETPAGDLLQEIQRLHELRARIQERAVKNPVPVIDSKFCGVPDVPEITETGQTASFQERIKELEQKLQEHEETENKRTQEKELSKQREEELLDENYRLTERIYWFENQIRNYENSSGDRDVRENFSGINEDSVESEKQELSKDERSEESQDSSSSKTTLRPNQDIPEKNSVDDSSVNSFSSTMPGMEKICESSKLPVNAEKNRKEYGKIGNKILERLDELVQVEVQARQRIVDLERREATYMKTLQKANETWAEIERGYSSQLDELRGKLDLEFTRNDELTRRAEELENKLDEFQKYSAFQEDVVEYHGENSMCEDLGVDEVDLCSRQNLECEEMKKSSVFIPMDVDQSLDVVDGETVELGDSGCEENEENFKLKEKADPKLDDEGLQTECQEVEFTDVIHPAQNLVPASVSIVNLNLEQNTERTTELPKIPIPEATAELATEAKEDASPKGDEERVESRSGDTLGIEKAEEVKETSPRLVKDDRGVDVGEDEEEEAEAESVMTINKTEPEKKCLEISASPHHQADNFVLIFHNLFSLEMKPSQGFSVVYCRIGGFLPAEEDPGVLHLSYYSSCGR